MRKLHSTFTLRLTLTLTVLLAVFFVSPCVFAKEQVGEIVDQVIETPHPYQGRGVVWEKEFSYPYAGYIAIHFSKFDLAGGDYIEISSPDGRFRYTYKDKGKDVKDKNRNNKQISEFWATHIPGEKAIARLVSRGNKSNYGIVIDKWARGYETGYIQAVTDEMGRAGVEAVCSADDKEWAKCYDGTEMYNKSRAISRLLINGNTACTGWLLGSEGHVMTNQHCIETQADADNTDFEFMAEGATCATSCSSWMACPGTVAASSGTLVKVDYDLDYALVLLPSNVSPTYGYLQLRNQLPTVGERIYVPQHASAYGKQLAVNSDADSGYAKIYSTSSSPCHGGPGDIGYYADTAGGSSGSPVIAYADHLVVALHHCGTCPNRGVPIPSIIANLGTDLPDNAVGGGGGPVQYCTTYGKNQNYEWIARVQLGNLDHSTGASAYSDYSLKKANLTAGTPVSLTLTPGTTRTATEYWKIRIDYNGDGDFADSGEEVFSGSGTSVVSGNFTVPSGTSGEKRMRISLQYGSSPAACGAFIYGEVEDYTANIQ